MDSSLNKFLYKKESYEIIDAAKEVWMEPGGAFKEKIAEKAFKICLQSKGYHVDNQKRLKVFFKNTFVGTYVLDIVVNEIILIELKCKEFITKGDTQQLWYYLKATNYKLGFVINFSPSGVQYKRIVYDTAR